VSLPASRLWAWLGLAALVAALTWAQRRPATRRCFRWLPVPLWCYLLPMLAVSVGWLPREDASGALYGPLTAHLLPPALVLLLLGADPRAVLRAGKPALIAAVAGAAGIVLGAVAWTGLLRDWLPAQAWTGAGLLAATWTGGTMNFLAMRALVDAPESIFAPLLIVDPLIAYGWMACLIALSSRQGSIDRWLRARRDSATQVVGASVRDTPSSDPRLWLMSVGFAVGVAMGARWLAQRLPTGGPIASGQGWVVLLATTAALLLASVPAIRRLAQPGGGLGYGCLYLVLAAAGAQGRIAALRATPAWLLVGVGTLATHALFLLGAARWRRVPLGVLATASQANVGGLVSAPLVGAVYHHSLAAIGLLLAVAGNAAGTYLGLAAAHVARWLAGAS
jgi:uncharacterized membrane protein